MITTPEILYLIAVLIMFIFIIILCLQLDNKTEIKRLYDISKKRDYILDVCMYFLKLEKSDLEKSIIKVDDKNRTIVLFNKEKNEVIWQFSLDYFDKYDLEKIEEERIKKIFQYYTS